MEHYIIKREGIVDKYLRDDLAAEKQEEFEDHLRTCQKCLRVLHDAIAERAIMDGYLLHQLADGEEEVFERHYFSCAFCFQELKEREAYIHAIETAHQRGALETTVEAPSPFFKKLLERAQDIIYSRLFAPAVAVLALLMLYPALRGLVIAPQLQEQIETLRQPQPNQDTYALNATRGPESESPKIIVHRQETVFLLSFNIEKKTPSPIYRAEIRDSAGKVIWRNDRLQPIGRFEVFSLTCHSSFFKPGEYALVVREVDSISQQVTQSVEFIFTIALVKDEAAPPRAP